MTAQDSTDRYHLSNEELEKRWESAEDKYAKLLNRYAEVYNRAEKAEATVARVEALADRLKDFPSQADAIRCALHPEAVNLDWEEK